jgi:hypothetical protein
MKQGSRLVVRRSLHTDLPPDALWREVLALDWLGEDVHVQLHAGGSGSLVDDDGSVRRLVIDEIAESRIRLHWWPAHGGPPSDVQVTVVGEGEGARLDVTEVVGGSRLDASAKSRRWDARLQALAERCASLLSV